MRTLGWCLVAVVCGCSSSPGTGDSGAPDSGAGPNDSGSPDAGTSDAGPSDSGTPDSGAADAGPFTYTVTIGPISVDAGVENTQCIVVDVGNPAPAHVGTIQSQLSGGAYQMAIYKVASTPPQPTPFDCTALGGVGTSTDTALTVTKAANDGVTLPSGTAFSLDAHQMVRLELHFLNTGSSAIDAGASVALTTSPDSQFQSEASLLWVGDRDISVGPGATASVTPFLALPSAFSGARFFAFSGDEHQAGTLEKISSAASAQATGTLLYQSTNWMSSPTTSVTPAAVPTDGGFAFECDWSNLTGQTLIAGTASTNEACNFAAYFSPRVDAGTPTCLILGGTPYCSF